MMFVRMKKLDVNKKQIVKYVTEEVGKILVFKRKATLVEGPEKEFYETEKAEADASSRAESPAAYAKKSDLSKKAKEDSDLKTKLEKLKSQGK